MPTFYYRLDVGGYIQGVPPPSEPILVGGVQLRANKYDYHFGGPNAPEGYFVFRVVGMSATRPDDYSTATIEVDHGNVDHAPLKAWYSITIADPDFDIPWELDQTSMSGDFRNLSEDGSKVGVSDVTLDLELGLVGKRAIADFVEDAKDAAIALVGRRMGLAVEAIEDLKARIDNAVAVHDALVDVQKGAMDFLGSVAESVADFDAAAGDGREFDAKLDALILGAQDKALEVARETQTFSDPAQEALFDLALGAGTMVYTLNRDGALDLNLNASMELGPVSVEAGVTIKITATDSTDLVIDGTAAADIEAGGGNDIVSAGGGADKVTGGTGNDYIHGGGEDDLLAGDEGNDYLNGGTGVDDMAGGAGDDVYVVDASGDVVREVAGGGADRVESSAGYSLGSQIEDLVLTGTAAVNGTGNGLDNRLRGNGAGNALSGGAGNDVLDGGAGADTLNGGAGDDLFIVDDAGDRTIEGASAGRDRVSSSVSYTLAAEIEELTLTGTSAIDGTGNGLDNIITGNDGANRLDGGLGADTLLGGGGNDFYRIAQAGDVAIETGAGGGFDRVASSIDYVLGDHLEVLAIVGAALSATGNGLANQITGNGNANVLDGGAGDDEMAGGAGDDLYIVSEAGDRVVERDADGIDTVRSSASFALGDHVENLELTGSASANATGNGLANRLTGNGGANVLDGAGGADTMAGGAGNDTYVVDEAGDRIVEAAGAGIDFVRSSVSFTLGANVEQLTLTGDTARDATGNALANVLVGNAAANRLDGQGGSDRMRGGAGDDIYLVSQAGDEVIETAGGGTDIVLSGVTVTLSDHVENLTLTGTASVAGTGNTLANIITGNDGANRLDGAQGADRLSGGLGDDTYVVDDAGDRIADAGGSDKVLASITFTLGGDFEGLILTGTAAINGTGNADANTIAGNAAANLLDGAAGADVMAGGAGDDSYIVDDVLDRAIEVEGGGIDSVRSSVSLKLAGHLENLVLVGSAAEGVGNLLVNSLTGTSGANRLDGAGGADTMRGGAGDDIYVADSLADRAIEAAGEGTDTVLSSASFSLGAHLENLTLTGSASVAGTGNDLANILLGNTGANRLDGGTGADLMRGGAGDDIYVIDEKGDRAIETSSAHGTDLVLSAVSLVLQSRLENLALTGTAALSGTGNELANTIAGNAGANLLDGRGGADLMQGGAGDDTYRVDDSGDRAREAGAADGTDRVISTVSYMLSAHLEGLTLAGNAAIDATGNAGGNILTGNAAANRLDGGAGADVMQGGAGDDTYVVDEAGDRVVETSALGGMDLVLSSVSVALGANVEKLNLYGTAAADGTGNALANVLVGNAAANRLDGRAGADVMRGGAGNDTYLVDQSGDQVVETSDADGIDTVASSIAWTLGARLENLTLSGSAAIDGKGNALANVLVGNAAANRLDGGAGADVMQGGGGNDTYLVDHEGDRAFELAPSQGIDTVLSSVSLVLGAGIERLFLTGPDALDAVGNELRNILSGNGGANILDGRGGADEMTGGGGNDTYVVDATGDVVVEAAGEGLDLVRSSVSHMLADHVERLVLTASAVAGTGNALANALTGNDANNRLDGGGGADRMTGGAGHDQYWVDDAGDQVVEAAGGGVDTIVSTLTWQLGEHVEYLELAGTAAIDGTGNARGNRILGNAASNRLAGEAGNDLLDGGAGADVMIGGAGDDIFVIDHLLDAVTEVAGEGDDLVRTGLTHVLGAHFERLELTGTLAINGTGNDADNIITGNLAANQLLGGGGNDALDGGEGADRLEGGSGDDGYQVDSSGDVVVEAAGAGTDTVNASVTFTLGANLEKLVLTGTAAAWATGNALDNRLEGNDAANRLNGDVGADLMIGRGGDDQYWVDNAGDQVVESGGEGYDQVFSTISCGLGSDVEELVLIGTAAIDGFGNGLSNRILGNSAANSLYGLDGDDVLEGAGGIDRLTGGAGNDTYVSDGSDIIVEIVDAGLDEVLSTGTLTLADNVENLVLTGLAAAGGTGNALANHITGNSAANALSGLDGDDRLDGGAGSDTLTGGTGDDIYIVNVSSDQVIEAAGGGGDTVHSSAAAFTLAANVERLILEAGALDGTGNALANYLGGNDLGNWLDGGAGDDEMWGGYGDDTYVVDSDFDYAVDLWNGGHDTVRSSISYMLPDYVEDLVLMKGLASIDGTGNQWDNRLTGNLGDNYLLDAGGQDYLDGGGGSDILEGGIDDDTYVYRDLTTIIEAFDGGRDTVIVVDTLNYAIGANIEDAVFDGTTNAIFGNELDNRITGNALGNLLAGGEGSDILAGGLGDDTYRADLSDTIVEEAGGGIDTVEAQESYTLGANVENLQLRGDAETGTGNALDNGLTGWVGSDTLLGLGGNDILFGGESHELIEASDRLEGGDGNDRLVVDGVGNDVLLGGAGMDSFWFAGFGPYVTEILDFNAADDAIVLDRDVFTGLGPVGTLSASAFNTGGPLEADDRIIYTGGMLFYDADGSGGSPEILLARLEGSPSMTYLDIVIAS